MHCPFFFKKSMNSQHCFSSFSKLDAPSTSFSRKVPPAQFSSVKSNWFFSTIGARTLKMPVPYPPPNVGGYTWTLVTTIRSAGRAQIISLARGDLALLTSGWPPRLEFLLKTDSGYPKDTGVTLFTLATPGNPPRYHTHRSAPPVSTLAHSRGPGARQAEGL